MSAMNVRVYGLLFNKDKTALLISHEWYNDIQMCKFVGGGLEFGEGTCDALKREFREELNLEIEMVSHFYTTDFFVVSAFNSNSQVLSIYYLIEAKASDTIVAADYLGVPSKQSNGTQVLNWLPVHDIHESIFTFPIDKKVATLLIQYLKQ
jgi:8-oxo-dGTP diphosphatase